MVAIGSTDPATQPQRYVDEQQSFGLWWGVSYIVSLALLIPGLIGLTAHVATGAARRVALAGLVLGIVSIGVLESVFGVLSLGSAVAANAYDGGNTAVLPVLRANSMGAIWRACWTPYWALRSCWRCWLPSPTELRFGARASCQNGSLSSSDWALCSPWRACHSSPCPAVCCWPWRATGSRADHPARRRPPALSSCGRPSGRASAADQFRLASRMAACLRARPRSCSCSRRLRRRKALGRHFQQFVVGQEVERLLQAERRIGGVSRIAMSEVLGRMLVSFFACRR